MYRIVRFAMATAALALLPVARASGQDLDQRRALVDALARRAGEIGAQVQALRDSMALSAIDTVTVGAFRIVSPDAPELASRAAQAATDSLRPLGEGVMAMVREHVFIVRHIAAPTALAKSGTRPVTVSLLESPGARTRTAETASRPQDVPRHLFEYATVLLARRLDTAMGAWLSPRHPDRPALTFDTVTAAKWSQLRLQLASSPSIVERRCFDGSMRDCRLAMGLDPISDPIRTYYDVDGRRQLVMRWPPARRGAEQEAVSACIGGNDSVCIRLLAESGDAHHGEVQLRETLVRLALQHGGSGAPERLLRGSGSVERQLELTAGVPIDSLVLALRHNVRTRRIPSDSMSPGMAFTSIGWIGLLAFLAVRNRRWR